MLTARLISAADRGVRVRLLLDDFNFGSERELIALCAHPRIQVRVFNPVSHSLPWVRLLEYAIHFARADWRMHNKLFIADNEVAILGGRNIGNDYFDVQASKAFRDFDVLAAEDDLDAQRANLESVNRQLEQAEKRYEVGLIAVTDVEEARAAHDSGAAAVIASKRALASAHELLREITGDAFDYLARPIEPFELATPDPTSEDRWVDMALQQNLALVSSRLAADIAR